MDSNKLEQYLKLIMDSVDQEEINLYNKLSEGVEFKELISLDDFYFRVIYPHKQYISGLIKVEISTNPNIEYILQNLQYIENHFVYWIEKKEGSSCCYDKTKHILKQLYCFYKDGTKIEFDYSQEYTYHLPKEIFKSHEEIIEFYEGIRDLSCGNPEKYLKIIHKLINK